VKALLIKIRSRLEDNVKLYITGSGSRLHSSRCRWIPVADLREYENKLLNVAKGNEFRYQLSDDYIEKQIFAS
jgi:hypothetical protein